MSNNSFDISGDLVRIHTADGMFHAVASIRDDYRDELMSVTWGKNGKYFYNAKKVSYIDVSKYNYDRTREASIQRKFLIL